MVLRFFKKSNRQPANQDLYCQSSNCRQLINPGQEVARIFGAITHPEEKCIVGYINHVRKNGIHNVYYIPYAKAQKLARRGKIHFSKLEVDLSR